MTGSTVDRPRHGATERSSPEGVGAERTQQAAPAGGITPAMIAATRAHIQACYENDLAALDRLAAIAAHQQAEGASL